jgi:HPt (histidine-containing phosphotransfer) domain-containing protein
MTESLENFKKKWNVQQIDTTTIARLLSELEGAAYLLDCIDEEDYKIIDQMRKKYYKKYFRLKKTLPKPSTDP